MTNKLRDGYIPSKIVKRIGAGEEHTTSEWAKIFNMDRNQMSGIFVDLRKKGYMYYPIGTERRFNGEGKEGIIKDILKSKKYYREVSKNYLKDKIKGHIHGMFLILENTLLEFPEIFAEAESAWNGILIDVLTKKEQLKLDKPNNANHSSSDK